MSQLPQSLQTSSTAPTGLPVSSTLSCYPCKSRKLRCDKATPICGRCTKVGEECQYPSARKRPVFSAPRPRVRDMEAKLRELEERMDSQKKSTELHAPTSVLVETGRFEQLPPPEVAETLTLLYFEKLQTDSLMIRQDRYLASLYKPPHMQPPMCLQYSILATGASASPAHEHLAEAFYGRARHYIQADEMQNDDAHVSLAHVQAWILIAHFEAQHLWFSRASMSIARAVRLAQILGLHRLDGKNNAGLTLPPAMDVIEEEERRKTFWTMFCTDRITSSTGGWPTMMDARTIQTHLPASTDTSLYGMPGPSVTLKQALKQDMWGLSNGACRVVAVHLFNECFNFTRDTESDGDDNVWEQLVKLETSLSRTLDTLPLNLRCPENIGNVDAVFINLQLHTALICIYRAAITRSPPDMSMLPYIQTRVFPSALHIVTIVALVADIGTAFRNPLISFAAYIAASFFMADFLSTSNRESEEKLTALMDVMIDVGKRNPFTASLAVRLAQELKTSGVDPGALEKVEALLSTLSINTPLPAQDDKKNGVVILCPVGTISGDCPL